ncbi:lipopolysaccharide biosynthesis protein [Leptolyngbya sp. FACHB-17]|uniref:lipopolysaccharide biosynthesis protein n=1 Tax=unclassified Leptolyngbya TaxID=2650499 RepID=UPI00168072B7|nr:lipopolysaccharide biosynthesis protein [Leptolyngbya sp. FACHB-17]MBD2081727.1 lipopolysaccharide biosynthesis protein [Leptolyngbya sp. FACHB-17]
MTQTVTRSRRSINNFASALLLQVVTVGIGIVSTPLLLKWLGNDRFGAFRSASDWLGHLKLLELGLGGSLMPLIAIALGQGDQAKVRLTLSVGIRAYFKVACLMLSGAIVLGYLILHLVPVQAALTQELQLGYWLGLLSLIWLPLTPFRLLADAAQRSDLVNFVFIVQSLIITGLSLYLAQASVGIPGQFLAVVAGTAIASLLLSWRGICRCPDAFSVALRPPRSATHAIQQQIDQLSVPTLLFNVSGHMSLLTDNMVIAYFLGSASVVPFVLTQRLGALAQAQVQVIGNAAWAALADLYANKQLAAFNAKTVYLTKLVVILGLMLTIPITLYNPKFVQLWVGPEQFAGWQVNVLAAINAVLLGVLSLWGWCFTGTGNITKFLPIALTGSSVNIAVSLLATPVFKMSGPLLGTFVALITVYLWWIPCRMKQVFGTSVRALIGAIARPLLVALFYLPGAIWFAQTYPPDGWLTLGFSMSAIAITFLGIAWLSLLNSEERSEWSQRFKQFF